MRFGLNQFTTPKLTDLTGTVFTVAAAVPAALATAAVSPSIASTASTPVPVQTATFQTTSELTLTLEASQASQVSSGLSALTTTMVDGGGGGDDAEASSAANALLQFLFNEFDFLPKILFNLEGEVRAGAAPIVAPTPTPASTPSATPAASQSNNRSGQQQKPLSALELFLRHPAPTFHWAAPIISMGEIQAVRPPSQTGGRNPVAPAKEAAGYVAAVLGAGLAMSGQGTRRKGRRPRA